MKINGKVVRQLPCQSSFISKQNEKITSDYKNLNFDLSKKSAKSQLNLNRNISGADMICNNLHFDKSDYSSMIKTESLTSEYQKYETGIHRPVNSYPNNFSLEFENTRRESIGGNNDTINSNAHTVGSNVHKCNIHQLDNMLHEVSPSRYDQKECMPNNRKLNILHDQENIPINICIKKELDEIKEKFKNLEVEKRSLIEKLDSILKKDKMLSSENCTSVSRDKQHGTTQFQCSLITFDPVKENHQSYDARLMCSSDTIVECMVDNNYYTN